MSRSSSSRPTTARYARWSGTRNYRICWLPAAETITSRFGLTSPSLYFGSYLSLSIHRSGRSLEVCPKTHWYSDAYICYLKAPLTNDFESRQSTSLLAQTTISTGESSYQINRIKWRPGHTHTHTHRHTNTQIHTRTHTGMNINTHTHTHTHTQA